MQVGWLLPPSRSETFIEWPLTLTLSTIQCASALVPHSPPPLTVMGQYIYHHYVEFFACIRKFFFKERERKRERKREREREREKEGE